MALTHPSTSADTTPEPPVSAYLERPDYRVDILRRRNRVRAYLGDQLIAETVDVLLVDEQDHGLVFYFPADDVRMDLLVPTDHHTRCPFKGVASYWSVAGAGADGENVVWGYLDPFPEVERLRDHVAFYQDKLRIEVGVAPRVVPSACGI